MKTSRITDADLESIKDLQPEGWTDILISIKTYLAFDFCYPLKVEIDNRIVGIGTAIAFENTGWLAHIIVHCDYRNRGIGFKIVAELLNHLERKNIATVLLIATDLGEPVYQKSGFTSITDYVFFNREQPWGETRVSSQVVPFQHHHYDALIELDQRITGEKREPIIQKHLDDALLYCDEDGLTGFYLPHLGEGFIGALHAVAGVELMKAKYSKIDRAVVPAENLIAIDFLKQNGFIETETRGKRMLRGEPIPWIPQCIFSRIGGNFG